MGSREIITLWLTSKNYSCLSNLYLVDFLCPFCNLLSINLMNLDRLHAPYGQNIPCAVHGSRDSNLTRLPHGIKSPLHNCHNGVSGVTIREWSSSYSCYQYIHELPGKWLIAIPSSPQPSPENYSPESDIAIMCDPPLPVVLHSLPWREASDMESDPPRTGRSP